jgi:hypothetical protein
MVVLLYFQCWMLLDQHSPHLYQRWQRILLHHGNQLEEKISEFEPAPAASSDALVIFG